MSEKVDFWNLAARRKLGASDGWTWFSLERVGDTEDTIVTGGIPRELKRGPGKGKNTFRGVVASKCVVTRTELETELSEYEQRTLACHECQGEGKVPSGWSKEEGEQHRECRRCHGTGRAPAKPGKGAA